MWTKDRYFFPWKYSIRTTQNKTGIRIQFLELGMGFTNVID